MKIVTATPARDTTRFGSNELSAQTSALARHVRSLQSQGVLDLPPVGSGRTAERHAALCAFGCESLSLARVVEAHTDALAILHEASRPARANALYGVWASDAPNGRLDLVENERGQLVLQGIKRYCSGSQFLDAALVTAHCGNELFLADVALSSPGIRIDSSKWRAPAFAATATGVVEFENVPIDRSSVIGESRWYLDRPGFWNGAVGPAACWAGGALGLVDAARSAVSKNPHTLAHLGAMEASAWGFAALLDRAGREIDEDPLDGTRRACHRALSVRHLVERGCHDVMDHFGRATGPALLAYDSLIAQRYAELTLYIRQCHGERDLQLLAESSP